MMGFYVLVISVIVRNAGFTRQGIFSYFIMVSIACICMHSYTFNSVIEQVDLWILKRKRKIFLDQQVMDTCVHCNATSYELYHCMSARWYRHRFLEHDFELVENCIKAIVKLFPWINFELEKWISRLIHNRKISSKFLQLVCISGITSGHNLTVT